jgi:undecaprenyl-diphosphatase
VVLWLKAAILGIVQGITEFLPVSSTAHLLIGERLLGFDDPGSVFTEMIQLGSILAIVWLYRRKVLEIITGLGSRPEARRFAVMLILATLPALIVGGLASDYIETVLHRSIMTVAVAFIAGGIVMGVVELLVVKRAHDFGAPRPEREGDLVHNLDDTRTGQAVGIGIFQVLALIPGVSRSGSTIVGGLIVGLDRPTAAEFSFFLAMPTMAAAFGHSLLKLRHQITSDRLGEVAIGFVMAFIASAIVVKPFLAVVRRRGFAPFAWYRIVIGVVLLAAMAAAGWGF